MRRMMMWAAVLGLGWMQCPAACADQPAELVAVLDKAGKAAGGEAKLGRLQAMTWNAKATVEEGNVKVVATINGTTQGLDKQRLDVSVEINGMVMQGLVVMNGDKAWGKFRDKAEEAPKEAVEMMQTVIHAMRSAQNPLLLKDKAYTLGALGEVKVGDRPALGVKVSRKDYRDFDLFFDKETGLPAKCLVRVPDRPGGQEQELTLLFSDYKDMAGVKHFTNLTFEKDGKKLVTLELSDVKPQEKLDANTFAKPE